MLKNAIDWASRPYGDSAWKGKPVAIMGASPACWARRGPSITCARCFVFLDMPAVNQPEVMISGAADKFDKDGNLTERRPRS